MPDRYVREALLNSERWNTLGLDAREFYVRLLLVVDDFGCYTGNEAMLRNTTYRYGRQQPVPLEELHRADLIVRYVNDGKPYVALTSWGERTRRFRKYPAPPVFTDLPGIAYKGDERTHRAMDWRNPQRSDDVSILLDFDLRPVVPQPAEWRRITTDWMPLHSAVPVQAHKRPKRDEREATPRSPRSFHALTTQSSAATPRTDHATTPRTDHALAVPVLPNTSHPPPSMPTAAATTHEPRTDHAEPTAATPTAAAANGGIHLNPQGAGWSGISEAQRLHWQSMFADLSIPDQLDRAAEWLRSHPEERDLYETQTEGNYAFIVRWLLREGRAGAH